jgi:hypothetical protein
LFRGGSYTWHANYCHHSNKSQNFLKDIPKSIYRTYCLRITPNLQETWGKNYRKPEKVFFQKISFFFSLCILVKFGLNILRVAKFSKLSFFLLTQRSKHSAHWASRNRYILQLLIKYCKSVTIFYTM